VPAEARALASSPIKKNRQNNSQFKAGHVDKMKVQRMERESKADLDSVKGLDTSWGAGDD
jgi:hypothetical protein